MTGSTSRADETPGATRGRLGAMLCALGLGLVLFVLFNLLVNPYGAWPIEVIDPAFRVMSLHAARVSAPYRARIERSPVVLVGNSRVLEGMPIPAGTRDGFANLAMAGSTLDEMIDLLHLALHSGTVRTVVWGVDLWTFNSSLTGVRDAETGKRIRGDPWLRARETLLNREVLSLSLDVVNRARRGRAKLPRPERASLPWAPALIADSLAGAAHPRPPAPSTATVNQIRGLSAGCTQYELGAERFMRFERMVQELRAEGIELVAFSPPLHFLELEVIRLTGQWASYLEWQRTLARITPYWDFSGYDAPAALYPKLFDPNHFIHFRAPLGHLILRHVLGESCGECGTIAREIITAAAQVDASTVAAHLADADAARERFITRASPYTALVEREIAAHAAGS